VPLRLVWLRSSRSHACPDEQHCHRQHQSDSNQRRSGYSSNSTDRKQQHLRIDLGSVERDPGFLAAGQSGRHWSSCANKRSTQKNISSRAVLLLWKIASCVPNTQVYCTSPKSKHHTYALTAKTTDDGGWSEAIAKARAAVSLLTNEEKASLTLGSTSTKGCSGFIGPLSKLGFGGLCLQDNQNGVRGAPLVNGYAAQLSIGASWNRSLAYERGLHIGREHKAKGVSVALGPVSEKFPQPLH